jgi:Glycosyl transferase family 11
MSVVICKLPKAGLGNQLFPLVKAAVFAELNGIPLIVSGYKQFRIGPYLRGEKVKRSYGGYFNFQKNSLTAIFDRFSLWRYRNHREVVEPPLKRFPASGVAGKKFIFSSIPHWSDYFAGLKEHRDLAISVFRRMVRATILSQVETMQSPCIGVHIRMGDFRKLATGEDFKAVGAVRTPERYFMEMISSIREINGSKLPVSVFTDGYRKEFEGLFSLENVHMIEGNTDIADLLLLGKSKVIVTSAGSTFSYWSGFLSEAPLVMHPDHLHAPIRPAAVNGIWYEGPLLPDRPAELLKTNIRDIRYE